MFNELFTIKDHCKKLLPLLEQEHVQCALCSKSFKRITHAHLKLHSTFLEKHRRKKWVKVPLDIIDSLRNSGIDPYPFQQRDETLLETYERLFGGASILNAITQKLLDLYNPSRTRWILMDPPLQPKDAQWMHVTADDPAYKISRVSQKGIKMHLRAKCTMGVFSKARSATRFVIWDLDYYSVYSDDIWNPEKEAKLAAVKLVVLLKNLGFTPHVIASGQKGYHVIVFFRKIFLRKWPCIFSTFA